MIPKQSGIYAIRNIINNKVYVGSAKNFNRRWINQHRPYLRSKKHPNLHLQSSYNLYGEDNFVFEILEFVTDEFLLIREQYWLDEKQSYNSDLGYNINKFARSGLGNKLSEVTRAKMSALKKGKFLTDEVKDRISNSMKGSLNHFFGKKHSEESKSKISKKNQGKINGNYQRLRASESNKGKILSEEHKKSIVKSNSSRIVSDETREKMRDKKLGRKLSDETKQKMKESRKKYLEKNKEK